MFGGTALFIGLAAFFFFVYGGRKEGGKLQALESESWERRRSG